MPNFKGAQVGVGVYAVGYAKAFSRSQAADDAEDPLEVYLALSESLDGAHALDEEIARAGDPAEP